MADDDTDKFAPGTMGCHEALDRCSLLAGLVDDLVSHPAIERVPEWQAEAIKASRILFDLYSQIGIVHLVDHKGKRQ